MGSRFSLLMASTLAAAWAAVLPAQDSVSAGARVRLTIKGPRVSTTAIDTHTVVVTGRAVAAAEGALRIARETPPDTVDVALPSIVRLDVQVRESHAARGAFIGAALGAALGTAAIVSENGKSCPAPCDDSLKGIQYFAALVFVAGGAAIGARLGRAQWRRVSLPVRVGYSPQGSPSAALVLALRL